MSKQNETKFQEGMDKLLKKYQITKDKVIELAAKHPDLMYYTEDGLKLVVIGIIKLALKFKSETKCKKKKA